MCSEPAFEWTFVIVAITIHRANFTLAFVNILHRGPKNKTALPISYKLHQSNNWAISTLLLLYAWLFLFFTIWNPCPELEVVYFLYSAFLKFLNNIFKLELFKILGPSILWHECVTSQQSDGDFSEMQHFYQSKGDCIHIFWFSYGVSSGCYSTLDSYCLSGLSLTFARLFIEKTLRDSDFFQ